jgi:hypothetical protein
MASSTAPTRQIRAHLPTPTTIIVYQAYSDPIATAAVASQSLSASPLFNPARMTWIKPSWCWMMYRSGYSYKDANQVRILALTMRLEDFWWLLRRARVTDEGGFKKGGEEVRVQWDPERGVRLGRMEWTRSVQIGVPRDLSGRWVEEMVVGIEDVTERAREMKKVLDEDVDRKVGRNELVEMGLVPVEEVVDVPEDVRARLRMD